MAHETHLKAIEHELVRDTRRAIYHEKLAVSEVRPVVGGMENMNLGGARIMDKKYWRPRERLSCHQINPREPI